MRFLYGPPDLLVSLEGRHAGCGGGLAMVRPKAEPKWTYITLCGESKGRPRFTILRTIYIPSQCVMCGKRGPKFALEDM